MHTTRYILSFMNLPSGGRDYDDEYDSRGDTRPRLPPENGTADVSLPCSIVGSQEGDYMFDVLTKV